MAMQAEEATDNLRSGHAEVYIHSHADWPKCGSDSDIPLWYGILSFHLNEQCSVCVCVRMLVERVLLETTEDLRAQRSSVDQAFSQRCEELIEAKTNLELLHTQVDMKKVDWCFEPDI